VWKVKGPRLFEVGVRVQEFFGLYIGVVPQRLVKFTSPHSRGGGLTTIVLSFAGRGNANSGWFELFV
jgi:hypothetical protein